MSQSDAGKTDRYRPVDTEKYETNWYAIYNPPRCKECNKLMRQWMIGEDIFYCKNKECKLYLEKFERK